MVNVLAAGVTHLADNDFGDNLGDGVAGPLGLLIIVMLAIATVLLVRNMNGHLKRLPASFPDPRDAAKPAPEAASEPAAATTDDAAAEPVDVAGDQRD
jgi:hypothetical protein